MDPVADVCERLRARAREAKGSKSKLQVLEWTLSEMTQLSAGMVQGQVMTPDALENAAQAFSDVANEIFDDLAARHRDETADWLGQLPQYLQPSGLRLSSWRKRVGAAANRQEWWARREKAVEERRTKALKVAAGEQLTVENVEKVFGIKVPAELRAAWSEACGSAANPLQFLRYGLDELLRAAQAVIDEHAPHDMVAERVGDLPFSVVPFAEGHQESDVWVLDLAHPTGSNDYRVIMCRHDAHDPGGKFKSSSEWLREHGALRTLLVAFEEAVAKDKAVAKKLEQLVADGAEPEFNRWCRSVIKERAPELSRKSVLVKRAMDLFWEREFFEDPM